MRRSKLAGICLTLAITFPAVARGQTTQPAIQPATQPATEAAKISPAAQAMLDDLRQAYAKLTTLELAGTYSMDMDVAGEQQNRSTTFTASFEAPNKFRHEMKDDVIVVSTGEKLFSVLVSRNQYISVEAPSERTSTLPGGVGDLLHEQNPSLTLALAKDAGAELAESTSAIDQVDANTVKLTQADRDVLVSIDPQTRLLKKMQVDLTKLFTQQGVPQVKRAMITIRYDKSIAGGAADQARFAFAPPPGATLIKTEMAFMGDQSGPGDPNAEPAQKLVGQAAPTFQIQDLEGKAVAPLAEFKGKVIVLDFWASWCPPCREGMPHLDQLYKDQREQGVAVFAVNERESAEKAKAFLTQQNLTVPVLLDSDGQVGAQYMVTGIPQTVVISKDGKIAKVFVGFGPGSAERLAEAVEAAKSK
jgi:peroxiredoxin